MLVYNAGQTGQGGEMELLRRIVVEWFSWIYVPVTNLPDLSSQVVSEALLFLCFWGALLLILGIFVDASLTFYWCRGKDEPESIEVAPGVHAWDVDRNSLWVKYYHWHLKKYPTDICSYVKHSAGLLIAGLLLVVGFLNLAFLMIVILACAVYWIIYAIIQFFINLPGITLATVSYVYMAISSLPSFVVGFGKFASESTFNQWAIWAIAILTLVLIIYRFAKSRTCQVIKLRIKSFKEKKCLPIRVK